MSEFDKINNPEETVEEGTFDVNSAEVSDGFAEAKVSVDGKSEVNTEETPLEKSETLPQDVQEVSFEGIKPEMHESETVKTQVPEQETVSVVPQEYTEPAEASDNPYMTYVTPEKTGGTQPQSVAPKKPEKKKFKWGCLIFSLIFVMLFALFTTGFVGLCGYLLISGEDSLIGQIFDEAYDIIEDNPQVPTEPQEDILEGGVIPNESDENYSDDTYMVLHNPPYDSETSEEYTAQYAFSTISDSTVGIVCYVGSVTEDSKPQSQGTGIVLSKDGYVVTNSHVIGDSRDKYKVRVMTTDGTTYEARVIGYDSRTDLAVLKVDGKELVPATFCDSDKVYVGQDVIAVGNPGGMDFQNSLTKGIISAKDRELSLSSQVSYFQTDAAINPGNSGGPLCNMQGQVIGINTAKISSEDYEGMGFAIPTQTAKVVVDDLIKQGFVSGRVRIGITGQPVTNVMAQYYGLPSGILITEIAKDGPCDNTDIKVDDVLTAIDGEKVKSFSEIYKILATHEAGDQVELSLYNSETQENYTVKVTLAPDEGDTQQ